MHGLSEYTDRGWAVVLVFYPLDFHPACTDQWCSLRDADWLTILDDVVVLGVGSDGAYAHREYADKHNIQFPLLSDRDGQVSPRLQVLSIVYFLPLAARATSYSPTLTSSPGRSGISRRHSPTAHSVTGQRCSSPDAFSRLFRPDL